MLPSQKYEDPLSMIIWFAELRFLKWGTSGPACCAGVQDNKGVGQPIIILILFQHQVVLSYFELGDKNDPFINGRGSKLLNLIFDIPHSLRRGKPLPASPLLWPMQDNCTEKIGAVKKNRCSEEQIGEVKKISALKKNWCSGKKIGAVNWMF